MADHPSSWPALLMPFVHEWFPELAGQEIEVHPTAAAEAYTFSTVQRLRIAAGDRGSRDIVVKAPRGDKGANPQAEYQALSLLQAHFASQPHLRVPRPLLALADPPALVTEAVMGVRLHVLMRGGRRPLRHYRLRPALDCAAAAGEWLAHLHRLPPQPASTPAPILLERLDAALLRLQRVYRLDHSLLTMRNELENYTELPAPAVSLHGDFTLRNVICQQDGVVVLDTELALSGPPAYDLGWFLTALHFIDRWHLLSGGLLYDPAALVAVRTQFLKSGVTTGREQAAQEHLRAVQVHAAVRLVERWAEYAAHLLAARPQAARLFLPAVAHPFFRRALDSILAGLPVL